MDQPHTGIGQTSLGLLHALAKNKRVELTVVSPQRVRIPGLAKGSLHVLKPKAWLLHPALKKWFWERVQVPAFFARRSLDWEYFPYPCPLPSASAHRRAMVVHDTILWQDHRYQGNRLKTLYHRESKRALIHVDRLFTVSHATHDALGIPSAVVLPNGLPEIPTGLQKMPYQNDLIYLGGFDVRKQVPELVQWFLTWHKSHPESRLLLVGEPHHQSALYPKVPEHASVVRLGSLSEKALYSALQSAAALVHNSDSEGFNLPVLQALAVGTPAVLRDIPVNHEVSGGNALFFNPSSKASFSATLKKLENPKTRQALSTRGKQVARQFTWKKTAALFIKTLTR